MRAYSSIPARKFEARNSKSETSSKSEMEAVNETRALSCFEFVSNFGIRISDFSSLLQYTHLMPTYAAFLGHQPAISLAELMVMLPDLKPKKQWDPRIVTFETTPWGNTHLGWAGREERNFLP